MKEVLYIKSLIEKYNELEKRRVALSNSEARLYNILRRMIFDSLGELDEPYYTAVRERLLKGKTVNYIYAYYGVSQTKLYRMLDSFYLSMFIKLKIVKKGRINKLISNCDRFDKRKIK